MKNETFKNKKFDGYYLNKVPINFINDTSISSQSMRMMLMIQSDSDEYKIYLTNLANRMNVSYTSAQRYMKELQDADYVVLKRIDGIWVYYVYFEKLIPDRIVIGGANK